MTTELCLAAGENIVTQLDAQHLHGQPHQAREMSHAQGLCHGCQKRTIPG